MKKHPNHRQHYRLAVRVRAGRRPGQLVLAVASAATATATSTLLAWALAHIPW
ncbi:hypothetical protein ACF1G0_35000 [Streptomyces sp. NPDC013953]|uniref:hypothetical protein n=1 Tax=Streptomyces sp. NPDC013953 TaxID=3364868 RepID=UPI0036F72D52